MGFSLSVYRSDHHLNCFQGVGTPPVLSPKYSILVLAPVVAPSVPDPVEVGVGTRVVPPAALVEVSTVSCGTEGHGSASALGSRNGDLLNVFILWLILRGSLEALHSLLWSHLAVLAKLQILL